MSYPFGRNTLLLIVGYDSYGFLNLIQFYTWFQVINYRNFWNNERWKPYDKQSNHHYLFHMKNLFQHSASDISEMVDIVNWFYL